MDKEKIPLLVLSLHLKNVLYKIGLKKFISDKVNIQSRYQNIKNPISSGFLQSQKT